MATSSASSAQQRSIRFHPDTKENDGLTGNTHMFHEYMRDVLGKVKRPGGQTIVSILAQGLNVPALVTIRGMLIDLIERCNRSELGRAIILNRGGGSLGAINTKHISYLLKHKNYLDNVINKLRIFIASQDETS